MQGTRGPRSPKPFLQPPVVPLYGPRGGPLVRAPWRALLYCKRRQAQPGTGGSSHLWGQPASRACQLDAYMTHRAWPMRCHQLLRTRPGWRRAVHSMACCCCPRCCCRPWCRSLRASAHHAWRVQNAWESHIVVGGCAVRLRHAAMHDGPSAPVTHRGLCRHGRGMEHLILHRIHSSSQGGGHHSNRHLLIPCLPTLQIVRGGRCSSQPARIALLS